MVMIAPGADALKMGDHYDRSLRIERIAKMAVQKGREMEDSGATATVMCSWRWTCRTMSVLVRTTWRQAGEGEASRLDDATGFFATAGLADVAEVVR